MVTQITKGIGVVAITIYLFLSFCKLRRLRKETPQDYVAIKLLLIEMWVMIGIYFIFLERVVIALVF